MRESADAWGIVCVSVCVAVWGCVAVRVAVCVCVGEGVCVCVCR